MAEIKISVNALDDSISKLKELKQNCDGQVPKIPSVVGGGKSINQIESIAGMYKTLNTDLSELISNTISFLENAKQSYVSSDSLTSSKIKGK